MAKHLGSRRQPRLRPVPRSVAWGLGGFLGVATLTVVAVAQGIGVRQRRPRRRRPEHGLGAHGPDRASGTGRRAAGRPLAPVRPAASSPYRIHHGTSLALKPAAALARKIDDALAGPLDVHDRPVQHPRQPAHRGPRRLRPGYLPRGDDGVPADLARRRRRRHAGGAERPAGRAAEPHARRTPSGPPRAWATTASGSRSTGAPTGSRWRSRARSPTRSPASGSRCPTSCSATGRPGRSSG